LWDARTGKELATCESDGYGPIVFSPDGKTLVAGGGSAKKTKPEELRGKIRLVDPGTGKITKEIAAHSMSMYGLAYSPDGKTLASGSKEIKIWEMATWKEQITLKAETKGYYHSLVFSPDGRTLAAGNTKDRVIILWDMATGKQRASLTVPTPETCRVLFSPDGKTLVAGNGPGGMRFWDVATTKEIKPKMPPTRHVKAIALSPDGKTLAIGDGLREQSRIALWELKAGK